MNYFSYRLKLSKYSRERERLRKLYSKDLEVAKKKNDREEIESLLSALSHEQREPEEKMNLLKTHYLLSIADRLSLPTPPITEKDGQWEQSGFSGRYFLTNKGITELRSLIRQERRERRERYEFIFRLLTILTGLIGVFIGLISVLKK